MIPKKIHYCWFGNQGKPKLAIKCIDSWKRLMPEYEITEWNENNFHFDSNPYLKWCYENKKWAFLSDLARLIIVEDNGGIYFDTDVEAIRPFDELLQYDAFFGFENKQFVATGLGFGAVQHHEIMRSMIRQYENLQRDDEGNFPLIVCPALNTTALAEYGLKRNGKRQSISGIEIFSTEYLNPYDDPTGELNITGNTYSIHWYGKSWMSKKSVIRSKLTRPIHRIFGVDSLQRFRKN